MGAIHYCVCSALTLIKFAAATWFGCKMNQRIRKFMTAVLKAVERLADVVRGVGREVEDEKCGARKGEREMNVVV